MFVSIHFDMKSVGLITFVPPHPVYRCVLGLVAFSVFRTPAIGAEAGRLRVCGKPESGKTFLIIFGAHAALRGLTGPEVKLGGGSRMRSGCVGFCHVKGCPTAGVWLGAIRAIVDEEFDTRDKAEVDCQSQPGIIACHVAFDKNGLATENLTD